MCYRMRDSWKQTLADFLAKMDWMNLSNFFGGEVAMNHQFFESEGFLTLENTIFHLGKRILIFKSALAKGYVSSLECGPV